MDTTPSQLGTSRHSQPPSVCDVRFLWCVGETAQRRPPLGSFVLSTLIRQPDRRPQLLFPLLHSRLAHYQTFRCPLTADVVRRRFLSAIPELFWATARNKASTIISCAIRAAAFSPVMSDSSTLEQSTTSDSWPRIHTRQLFPPIILLPF